MVGVYVCNLDLIHSHVTQETYNVVRSKQYCARSNAARKCKIFDGTPVQILPTETAK